MIGAKIKLVDVERDSLCLDKEKAEKAITQNTKAVVLVSAGDDLSAAYTLKKSSTSVEFSN